MTSIIRKGKSVKGNKVSSADDLKLTGANKQKVRGVESTGTQDLYSFKAPVKQADVSLGGNKVTIMSEQAYRQTLFESVTNSRAGRYLTKADKSSTLKVDPYSQTVSEGGLKFSYKNIADDVAKSKVKGKGASPQNTAPQNANLDIALQSGQKSRTVSVRQRPVETVVDPTATRAVNAVDDIQKASFDKTARVIDQTAEKSAVAKAVTNKGSKSFAPQSLGTTTQSRTPMNMQQAKIKPPQQASASLGKVSFKEDFAILSKAQKKRSSLDVKQQARTLGGKSKLDTKTMPKLMPDSIVDTKTKTKSALVQRGMLKTRPLTTTRSTSIYSQLQTPKTPFMPTSSSSNKNMKQGFDVFVRESGQFRKASRQSFTRRGALDFGAFTVGNTPRASFELRPSSRPARQSSPSVKGSFAKMKMNFQSKGGGLFVEKKEKRIKSGGEKAGITRKGLLALRRKRMKRLF